MARVVCRVHRSDEQQQTSLTWSEGPDEFPKYHLDGQLYREMQQTARKVREQLGHVVKDYVDDNTPDDARRNTAYKLAAVGFDLYEKLFWSVPEDQTQADDVRRWLTQLRDRDEVESLEWSSTARGRFLGTRSTSNSPTRMHSCKARRTVRNGNRFGGSATAWRRHAAVGHLCGGRQSSMPRVSC